MSWKNNGRNDILEGDNFRISYLPGGGLDFLDLPSWNCDDNVNGETAILKDGRYYILNGNHKAEYEKLFPSFEDCYKYFEEHSEVRSSWSN